MPGQALAADVVSPKQNKKPAPVVVALDGPAASGKSTVAKLLAKELDFIHIDSGAMYRSLTLALMQELGAGVSSKNFGKKLRSRELKLSALPYSLTLVQGKQSHYLGERDITNEIRSPGVTQRITYIADDQSCRNWVNRMLRKISREQSIVVDGRDIGSVVFPDTPFKFFLVANVRVRAQRRRRDLQKMGHDVSLEEVEKDIEERDRADRKRPLGGLREATDAIRLETAVDLPGDIVSNILAHLQVAF